MLDFDLLSVELRVGYNVAFEELRDDFGNDETVVFTVDEVVENYGNHVFLISEVCLDKLCNCFNNVLGKNRIEEIYERVCNVNGEFVNNVAGILNVAHLAVIVFFLGNLGDYSVLFAPVVLLGVCISLVDGDSVACVIIEEG